MVARSRRRERGRSNRRSPTNNEASFHAYIGAFTQISARGRKVVMTLTNIKSLSLSLAAAACMTAILSGIAAPKVMLSRKNQVEPLATHHTPIAKNLTQARIDRCP